MQEHGEYQIDPKVLAKAAFIKANELMKISSSIKQRMIDKNIQNNSSSQVSVTSHNSNGIPSLSRKSAPNSFTMNELAVKFYSMVDFNGDVSDLVSAATSLFDFCKQKTKILHKSKHAAAIAEIDRNANGGLGNKIA